MNMNVNLDMYTALLGGEGIVKLSNGTKIKLKSNLRRRTAPRCVCVARAMTEAMAPSAT